MRSVNRRSFLTVIAATLAYEMLDPHAQPAGPATIMLMRHGEDIGETGFHLSPQGYKRAEALPKLFPSRLPTPQVIVATHASRRSNRPVETVEPLSRQLRLSIDNRFRDNDYDALAHALLTDERYAGKVVLVCWHHGKIPNLAKALGVTGAPRWPDSQFDHVWVIDPRRRHPELDDVHQQLLNGDR